MDRPNEKYIYFKLIVSNDRSKPDEIIYEDLEILTEKPETEELGLRQVDESNVYRFIYKVWVDLEKYKTNSLPNLDWYLDELTPKFKALIREKNLDELLDG